MGDGGRRRRKLKREKSKDGGKREAKEKFEDEMGVGLGEVHKLTLPLIMPERSPEVRVIWMEVSPEKVVRLESGMSKPSQVDEAASGRMAAETVS